MCLSMQRLFLVIFVVVAHVLWVEGCYIIDNSRSESKTMYDSDEDLVRYFVLVLLFLLLVVLFGLLTLSLLCFCFSD